MNNTEKKLIITAWVIIIMNNKILLVKRPSDTKAFPNAWSFPWWKLENWETLEKCAIRECQEEAWVTPINLSKYSFYEYEWNTFKTISHLFTWNIENNIQKSEFISWFTIEDLNNIDIAFDYKQIMKEELIK